MHSTKTKFSWQSRYPDLAFLLSLFPYKEKKLPIDGTPLENWVATLNLEEIEVLYISGLINHPLPKKITNWLENDQKRALIFIEEDLGGFAVFSQMKLLENPQIHFHYSEGDPTDALADMFPTDRLAIFEKRPNFGDGAEICSGIGPLFRCSLQSQNCGKCPFEFQAP